MATRTRTRQAKASGIGATAAAAQEQLLNTVHQVWLAGLGAVSKARKGAPQLFEDLVQEGARVHASASKAMDEALRSVMTSTQSAIQGRVDNAREKASDTLENLEKMFQTRVQRALQQVGVPSGREIDKLTERVEALNASIEKLTRKRVPAGGKRPAGRRGASASRAAAH